MRRLAAAVLLCLFAPTAWAADFEPVEARLVTSTDRVEQGRPFKLGVLLRVQRGWHVYWHNPGEAGLATSVRWILPEGWTAGLLRWPVPERFRQQGGAIGYGYADAVLLDALVTPPGSAAGAATVGAEVGWLACEKICVRGTKTLELAIGPEAPGDAVDPALFAAWAARLPTEPDADSAPAALRRRGAVPRSGASGSVAVTVDWSVAPLAVEWFPPDDPALRVEATEARTRGRRTVVTFRARRLPGEAMRPGPLAGVLAWGDTSGRRHGLVIPIDLEGGEKP